MLTPAHYQLPHLRWSTTGPWPYRVHGPAVITSANGGRVELKAGAVMLIKDDGGFEIRQAGQ